MITSIRLVNFKNFADETLSVGPFTVIVGANASGKSNIRDAFRFLHGIGRGYTLAEIIGGKYGPGGQREWEPIRGAPNEIARLGPSSFSRLSFDSSRFPYYWPSEFSLYVELKLEEKKTFFSIKVRFGPQSPDGFQVLEEELKTEKMMIYRAEEDREHGLCLFTDKPFVYTELSRSQPALTQVSENDGIKEDMFQVVDELIYSLSDMRFLELSPERMREPSFPGATKLGDSGENLPTVLEDICADPKRKKILADWLSELTPMDVADFEFPRDPSGRVHLMLCEANGRKVSAYSASDGTLRFLAMLAALLGTNPAGLYFFEEIDNGIHPVRQSLLLELIEKQAAKGEIQVVTTTHSPDLLTIVNDDTFENTSVVCRLEDADDAIIRPVAELPNARELRTSGRGFGGLLAEGWMETALGFTENHGEAEGDGE